MVQGTSSNSTAAAAWKRFAALTGIVCVVSDGWSGKPSPVVHQLLLLPFTVMWLLLLLQLVRLSGQSPGRQEDAPEYPQAWWIWFVAFEVASIAMIGAEGRHFAAFGYHVTLLSWVAGALVTASVWLWFARRREAAVLFLATGATWAAGVVLAIGCFPLNYLRSDMLPVIGWADDRLLHGMNAYEAMHVGTRVYDFPYLPGMLVAFLPAVALHADLRFATLAYLLLSAWLIYKSARPERRFEVATLLGLFLLCPFLQYRHDLYLEPHWFALTAAVVLMQRGRWSWSALVWGVGCAIYQLSWVLLPFVLLYGFRRGGVREALRQLCLALLGFLLVAGPFLKSASERIASNTVGQWSRLPHALADPINVSYWLTYLIRPDQLQYVQAGVLIPLFGYCVFRGRCATLADTLRWMVCALAVFVPLNVIVDGYFYLTILLVLLFYLCAVNEWWADPANDAAEALLGAPEPAHLGL